jgi:transposase
MMAGMPAIGRPKTPLVLTEDERTVLERWSRRGRTAQSLALRSKIVLGCADGKSNKDVARQLRTSPQTVCKWRARFVASRLEGLEDEFRPGAPRNISDEMVEKVVVKTLEEMPADARHWSVRSMAKATGMSQTAIFRIWQAFGLQPHRVDSFKLSNDPLFIDKVRDIVGLYLDPPEAALVLCVDEKAQIQALDRTQPILPLRPGLPERRTHDYTRHGTSTLFAVLDVASGKVIGEFQRRHRAVEFRKFLETVDKAVPDELDVHLILDNYSTHKRPAIQKWLLRHPRFYLHFTPTYSSWLNLIEIFFGIVQRKVLTEKWIRRGTHQSTLALENAIKQWLDTWNAAPRPFVWTKTADEILATLAGYLQRISGTGH